MGEDALYYRRYGIHPGSKQYGQKGGPYAETEDNEFKLKLGLDIGAPAKDNETQEDALYYRRYGYYPGTHAYHHVGGAYGVIGANESGEGAADNETKEDEIHYGPPRRYGAYYPGYHYTTGHVVGHHLPAYYDNAPKEEASAVAQLL